MEYLARRSPAKDGIPFAGVTATLDLRHERPCSRSLLGAALLAVRHNYSVAGFIVLEDGRSYAAANWATDSTLRAISREVSDPALRGWLLAQQSKQVGIGLVVG